MERGAKKLLTTICCGMLVVSIAVVSAPHVAYADPDNPNAPTNGTSNDAGGNQSQGRENQNTGNNTQSGNNRTDDSIVQETQEQDRQEQEAKAKEQGEKITQELLTEAINRSIEPVIQGRSQQKQGVEQEQQDLLAQQAQIEARAQALAQERMPWYASPLVFGAMLVVACLAGVLGSLVVLLVLMRSKDQQSLRFDLLKPKNEAAGAASKEQPAANPVNTQPQDESEAQASGVAGTRFATSEQAQGQAQQSTDQSTSNLTIDSKTEEFLQLLSRASGGAQIQAQPDPEHKEMLPVIDQVSEQMVAQMQSDSLKAQQEADLRAQVGSRLLDQIVQQELAEARARMQEEYGVGPVVTPDPVLTPAERVFSGLTPVEPSVNEQAAESAAWVSGATGGAANSQTTTPTAPTSQAPEPTPIDLSDIDLDFDEIDEGLELPHYAEPELKPVSQPQVQPGSAQDTQELLLAAMKSAQQKEERLAKQAMRNSHIETKLHIPDVDVSTADIEQALGIDELQQGSGGAHKRPADQGEFFRHELPQDNVIDRLSEALDHMHHLKIKLPHRKHGDKHGSHDDQSV